MAEYEIAPHEVLLVSGIGQAAKTPHFLQCNFFHALHGRALPLATGAKIANHDLTIIVNTGDGDCFAEGGNHFIHAIRRNVDLTVLAHDNAVYGLTKGQASPTAGRGMVTNLQSDGVLSQPLMPLALSLAAGAGFVARGFSGDAVQLSRIIQAAIKYKGFSFIDILQPCVSFNRINTYGWYKERISAIDSTTHDPENFSRAMDLAIEWEERIPVGILYQKDKTDFTSQLKPLEQGTLIDAAYLREKINDIVSGKA